MTATNELRKLLDERGVEYEAERIDSSNYFTWGENDCYSYTEYQDGTVLRIWDCTPEQAIAATLGSDDDYESKMDALLCRLTNGKWSKSRAYDLDFMVSCIDEKYEEDYADELAVTTQGTTEIVRCRDCKHYHKHKWFDIIPGTPLGSDMSDVCMFFGGGVKVEPGGFCKWGERREQ